MTTGAGSGRLVVGIAGLQPTPAERAWLVHHAPGGVILFARNCRDEDQLRSLCAELHALVPDLEIVADHEGGPVSQLAAAVGRPPAAWSLGVLDDVPLTARVHAETARRLRSVGVDRVLGPVADVLTAPRNPVIGSRAFGADTGLVTRHVVAAVTGLVDGGIRVCLKHWPGHGGAATDPHDVAADVGAGACAEPFEAGLNAGADAVMVGHVAVGRDGSPATLDPDYLAASRRRLAAGGVTPTWWADDATMGALRPAMADRGVPAPDDNAAGLVDPAALPRAWIAALTGAGCERVLVRGLPLGAWPLPGDQDKPVPAAPAPEPPHAGRPRDDHPYDEVRDRAWAVAGAGFAQPEAELLWWDLTPDDRWEVAGGEALPSRARLAPILAGHFAHVHDWDPAGSPGASFSRLLVTSHRPLPADGRRDPRLAANGICLVLGHPSLVAEVSAYLDGGWRVAGLPDIAGEDLFRFSGGHDASQNTI